MLLEPLLCQEAFPAFALEASLVPHVVLVVVSLLQSVKFHWLFTAIALLNFLNWTLTHLFVLHLVPDPLLCMIKRLLAVFEAACPSLFD